MEEPFWGENIQILLDRTKLQEFIPKKGMTENQIYNSIVRFTMYLSVILVVLNNNLNYLGILILGLLFTYLHKYYVNDDIVIKERDPQDLSISRVNCLIFRVNTPEGIVYHLFDAWSLIETRLTKTNPLKTFKTSKDDPNILSWNENENVYISCGDPSCNNKIHFISSINSDKDAETFISNIEETTSDEDEKAKCVICFEPANIRLGCGHAVYCSNECMDQHVAYQENLTRNAVCPFCKKDNMYNKQSLCIQQYK